MRVLEISNTAAAAYAGLLLTELGYQVDRLELAAGVTQGEDSDREARELFYHRDKQPIGRDVCNVDDYDAIVEDVGTKLLAELGYGWRGLHREYPQLVFVSLSPFGRSGLWRDWQATDINAQAAGGVIHGAGFEGETPRKLPVDAAAMIAGLHGATAVVSTAYAVAAGTETGVHIDISAQDCFMHHWTRHVSDYAYAGTLMGRQPRKPIGIPQRHTAAAADGFVFLLALNRPWQDVAAFLGLGDFLTPERMTDGALQPWDEMEAAFEASVAAEQRYDLFARAAEMGWTFAPVEDPWAAMNNPQTQARESIIEVQHEGKPVQVPGPVHRFT